MIHPKQHEERYYCRKGYHARNVLIISDVDLNILHEDVTFGGATHDSFIFSNSRIKEHLKNLNNSGETVYLLGDSGYAQRPYLMTPFTHLNQRDIDEYARLLGSLSTQPPLHDNVLIGQAKRQELANQLWRVCHV